MMRQKTEFLADCLHLLSLRKPVDFAMGNLLNDNWDAQYQETDRRHDVRVHPRTARCRLSLIAHELVHAWIVENHPKAPDHGKAFRRKAEELERDLRRIGWRLNDKIFIKGVDL